HGEVLTPPAQGRGPESGETGEGRGHPADHAAAVGAGPAAAELGGRRRPGRRAGVQPRRTGRAGDAPGEGGWPVIPETEGWVRAVVEDARKCKANYEEYVRNKKYNLDQARLDWCVRAQNENIEHNLILSLARIRRIKVRRRNDRYFGIVGGR